MEAAIKDLDAEIIVVDNNSPDDSCEMVKSLFPHIKLIKNTENLGFSKGNNIGVAEAKGDYLCILNPDTVVAEDTFIQLLEFAESKEDMGIVGCQLINGKGRFLPESKRNIPTTKVAFQKMIGYVNKYYNLDIEKESNGKTDVLVGAFMVIKREVYNKVGGFDEDYFMYGEDIDLSFKMLKSGFSNYYCGEATIIHYKGESTLKDKVYAKRFYEAMEIFYKKHFKKNILFSGLVRLSIKLASKKGPTIPYVKENNISHTVFVSTVIPEALQTKLRQPVTLVSNFSNTIENSYVVFDADYLSYKTIIDYIKSSNTSKTNSFRILPKNSTFILGSDSSIGRGQVLHF